MCVCDLSCVKFRPEIAPAGTLGRENVRLQLLQQDVQPATQPQVKGTIVLQRVTKIVGFFFKFRATHPLEVGK